jgi:hypothetical protein
MRTAIRFYDSGSLDAVSPGSTPVDEGRDAEDDGQT